MSTPTLSLVEVFGVLDSLDPITKLIVARDLVRQVRNPLGDGAAATDVKRSLDAAEASIGVARSLINK